MHWQNLVHLESGSSPVNLSLDWGPTLTKLTFDWWNNMKLTIRYNKYHNIISHFSFIIKLLYSTSLWLEYFFFLLCSSFSHHWYREGGRERERQIEIFIETYYWKIWGATVIPKSNSTLSTIARMSTKSTVLRLGHWMNSLKIYRN